MKLKFKKAKVESPIIADIFQVLINFATNLLPLSHFEHDNEDGASFQPYECDICGKVFDEEQNFKSHIESVHEGKKTYKFDNCGKVFDEEQNFKSRIESVHEGKKP